MLNLRPAFIWFRKGYYFFLQTGKQLCEEGGEFHKGLEGWWGGKVI